ncbi:hypothetical protein OSCI_3060026 [Kamptonema sp. PCC 6506]|nr:hypothetical protein OSCI_3060026 [Kamptonema sp. PCC 6506]
MEMFNALTIFQSVLTDFSYETGVLTPGGLRKLLLLTKNADSQPKIYTEARKSCQL